MISDARDQGDCGASWVFSTISKRGVIESDKT